MIGDVSVNFRDRAARHSKGSRCLSDVGREGWTTWISRKFPIRSRRRCETPGWTNLVAGMRRTCSAGWGCSGSVPRYGPPQCCSGPWNAAQAKCRSAGSVSPVSGGMDRSKFLDNRQFTSSQGSVFPPCECRALPARPLPIAGRFESGRMARIDEPLYPPRATREALTNVLCHRDDAMGGGSIGLAVHDDRLEGTSTGPLHFGLTSEDLFGPPESRPWNPLVSARSIGAASSRNAVGARSRWRTWRPRPGCRAPRSRNGAIA